MSDPSAASALPLALTMGEPAGVGGELALAAWKCRASGIPPFFLMDDPERLRRLSAALGLGTPVAAIAEPAGTASAWESGLPVLPQPLAAPVTPGRPDPANAPAVIAAIERAVEFVRRGQAAAVVTCPIQKQSLLAAGFGYPGHTEFLAALAGPGTVPVMMLASPLLRVVPVTIHCSLKDAIAGLTRAKIVETGRIVAEALARDFGLAKPRLALAGLNPHAGEAGAFGREDIEVVTPAVTELQALGIEARGPLPADTMFHPAARARYDAALCMYHDQALIPIKTLDFDGGVNVTLGLPFIRTSPDHGTALDLAGTGKARPDSLIAALRLAGEMAARRSLPA